MTQFPVFGAELRRLRLACGWSLAQLASRIHYSRGHISKIETGQQRPSPAFARRCDSVLVGDGSLAAFADRKSPRRPLSAHEDGDGVREPLVGRLSSRHCSKLVLGGTWPTDAVAPIGGLEPATPAVFTHAESAVRDMIHSSWQAAQSVTAQFLLPVAERQVHLVCATTSEAQPAARTRLLRLAASQAEFTSWLAQESGDEQGALDWIEAAASLASRAADSDLTTYQWIRRAEIALYRDDAERVIECARRAQAESTTLPRIKGLAVQREAQGYALAGETLRCRAALKRAGELLELASLRRQDDDRMVGPSRVPDLRSATAGWCELELGRPEDAGELLAKTVAGISASDCRTRALYVARYAIALAECGEFDDAVRHGLEALEFTDAVGSSTVAAQLRKLSSVLRRHHTHRSALSLSGYIDAVLRGKARYSVPTTPRRDAVRNRTDVVRAHPGIPNFISPDPFAWFAGCQVAVVASSVRGQSPRRSANTSRTEDSHDERRDDGAPPRSIGGLPVLHRRGHGS